MYLEAVTRFLNVLRSVRRKGTAIFALFQTRRLAYEPQFSVVGELILRLLSFNFLFKLIHMLDFL